MNEGLSREDYAKDRPGSLLAFLKALPPALPYKGRFLLALLRNRFRTRTVLFYPEAPTRRHVMWKLCHVLGWRITANPDAKFDYAFHFRDHTTKLPGRRLQAIAARQRVMNIGCTDITKSRVEAAFSKVFGYGSFVDPRTYTGVYVRKSENNGVHDAVIFDSPQEPEDGFIYQKLVDTEIRDGDYTEYRVPVFDDQIPIILMKLRPMRDRFQFHARAKAFEKADLLTPGEEEKLLAVCREIGADYAELDVKRDIIDGRLYVLDLNDTPSGIARAWGKGHYDKALSRLSAALKEMLEQTPTTTEPIPTAKV